MPLPKSLVADGEGRLKFGESGREGQREGGKVESWLGSCLLKSEAQLLHLGINRIFGFFDCPECETSFPFNVPLENHRGMMAYPVGKRSAMKKRASRIWMKPITLVCLACEESYLGVKLATKDRRINWVFLYLNRALGVLSKKQLQFSVGTGISTKTTPKTCFFTRSFLVIAEQLSLLDSFFGSFSLLSKDWLALFFV
ncbi:hypothetical protein Vadar_009959 [Vaccinium darrowii]|uniref:Uncharacterized protein n=1 Tax=Vaccinium darrowii TaxID=229202 RepID=A0ACB7Z395_9ERIC|nr:hypothetical protein Vadar_009959 [Vaccinium darrowii]